MAGVRVGVSYFAVSAAGGEISADSAAGEADALINIEAEHSPGRCDNFPAGFSAGELSYQLNQLIS